MLKSMWKDNWLPMIGTTVPKNELIALRNAIDMCGSLKDEHERELMMAAILQISTESHRAAKKRLQNKKCEEKRKLIGARLPRKIVEEYEREAEKTGRSIYSFVSLALENEYRRCKERS